MEKSGWRLAVLAGFALAVSLLGCGDQGPMSSAEDPEASKLVVSQDKAGGFADRGAAAHFSAEVPVAWFKLAAELFASERFPPPVASRALGYAGVALYEAMGVQPAPPGHLYPAAHRSDLGLADRHAALSRVYLWPLRPVWRFGPGAHRYVWPAELRRPHP